LHLAPVYEFGQHRLAAQALRLNLLTVWGANFALTPAATGDTITAREYV